MSGPPGERRLALLPTGRDGSTYACVRSLARHGVGTLVASEKRRVPAAASKFCTERASLPPPREDLHAYRDALLELAARDDVAVVVPVRPEDGYLLSRYRDEFAAEAAVVAPPMETMATVHDRLALAEAAEAAGVPVPATRPLSAVSSWEDDYIVKARYNVLTDAYVDGLGPGEVDVVKDLHHVAPGDSVDPEGIRESMGHDPVVQEFVPKDGEYMVAALYDRGDAVATFQHYQVRGNSYTGGGGVYRRSISDPDLESVALDLLDSIEYHGLACIEYMRHAETGEYVLTEVNPRMWQSLPSAVHAGADFPWYYWLLATGRAAEIDDDYELGVGTHLLQGELDHLASVLREDSPHVPRPSMVGTLGAITASCVREPRFDFLKLDDPGPFFAGVKTKTPF